MTHGRARVETRSRHRGPRLNAKRDAWIKRLHEAGHSARAIASTVGMSHAGVLKALRRMRRVA